MTTITSVTIARATGHVDGGLRRSTTDLVVMLLALGIMRRDIIRGAGILGLEVLSDAVMICRARVGRPGVDLGTASGRLAPPIRADAPQTRSLPQVFHGICLSRFPCKSSTRSWRRQLPGSIHNCLICTAKNRPSRSPCGGC